MEHMMYARNNQNWCCVKKSQTTPKFLQSLEAI